MARFPRAMTISAGQRAGTALFSVMKNPLQIMHVTLGHDEAHGVPCLNRMSLASRQQQTPLLEEPEEYPWQ